MSKNIITLCAKTICHFRTILNNSNSKAMLIGVKGGGCNGLKYYVEPTNDVPNKLDEVFVVDNVNIIVCGKSLLHLIGVKIKWKDDFIGSGLEFNNPNATSSCGCGETFSL